MTIDIVVRWAGPSDAVSGSAYKIERSLNNVDWSVLAATQAATTPYDSPVTTLGSNATYGSTSIALADGTSFSSTGYGWLDDALVEWTGKSVNSLTGCIWHSGYGTYASGTNFYEAHESYSDSGVTVSLGAVLYRITHTAPSQEASAPTYMWYYYPPTPASNNHCVVIVNIGTDLGFEQRSGVSIIASISADTSFTDAYGMHLDKGKASTKTQTTNAFGLAFFQCYRNSARTPVSETDAAYTFTIDSDLTVTVNTIPDSQWVLLSQVASSTA